MSKTISQMERGARGSVNWHIRNWRADRHLLKDYAECTMRINNDSGEFATSDPVVIRFSFKEHKVTEPITHNTFFRLELCGQLLSGGRPPMLISVNVETNTIHPQTFYDRRCTIEKHGKSFTVAYAFMVKGNYYNSDVMRRSTYDYPKFDELIFKITATILNFNKDTLLDESEEDAEGGDNYEASLVKDIEQIFSAGEDFSQVYTSAEQRDRNSFSDLQLQTKDNNTLQAHKLILGARSPGFRKLIREEAQTLGIIKATTAVNSEALTVILHWMYTGELHDNLGKVTEEVLEGCVILGVPELLKVLDKKLITICTEQNMHQLCKAAEHHGLEAAKEAISEFIKRNSDLFHSEFTNGKNHSKAVIIS